ncbi:glutamine amidotransferase-related protein, partial [Francisella tularensis]|uniref:glutamine amidotransferase-related protein n=1 Tax=Francisella tularensis TaxID=263 RepID=UPI0023AE68B5|nr:CTP synthetase [Francisella tularensis subsp. holarctica]
LTEAYKSLNEALYNAVYNKGFKVKIKFVDSEDVNENNVDSYFKDVAAILVPGGFGSRGVEGIILSIQYAGDTQIPF